jgi:hypothetical protein
MSIPIPLRWDFGAPRLCSLAKKTKDGPQTRRLLTLAAIYDGATHTEAAKIGSVGLQIIRDWVLRFNAHGPDGLLDRKPPGQPSKLNDGQRQAVAQMIESGPDPAGLQYGGDEPAPRGDSRDRRARCPRRPFGRSSWLAPINAPRRAAQHHHYCPAAEMPRAQPGRKRLAIPARQLALQPYL